MSEIAQQLQQGTEHHRAGRFAEAERCYRRVLELDRRNADAWNLLGLIAQRAGNAAAAIECLREAIALGPQVAAYYNNLGTIFEQDGQFEDAIACFQEAIRVRPDYATAYSNLGELLRVQGDLPGALACYREALTLDAYFFTCRSNLVSALLHDPSTPARTLHDEHKRWGRLKRLGMSPRTDHANVRDPGRPLKIGYVGANFSQPLLARFIEPLLRHHDRDEFAVYLYAAQHCRDPVSQRIESRVQGLFRTGGVATPQVVERIVVDEIDILIDLSGHSHQNRLDVFAERPAPVQATYLGYPSETGLETIDYRLTDAILDPLDGEELNSEMLVRLDETCFCFSPPDHGWPLAPSPYVERGVVTFGVNHAPLDLNETAVQHFGALLAAIPESRLIVFHPLLKGGALARLENLCAEALLPAERVELRTIGGRDVDRLAVWNEIDIALDAYPASNLTMTCEALWLGLPVVTLTGDRPASRVAASVLHHLGLDELIASSPSTLLSGCQRLAHNTSQLQHWRQSLRGLMQARLCDGASFTRRLEAHYRDWWRRWCEK